MEISFGNWVRRRRKGLDLTQEELARQVGCSASLIFKIETDERRPSRQIAELLAERLEIPATQREMFIKAARQELAVMRLDDPVSMPQRENGVRMTRPSSGYQQDDRVVRQPSTLPVFPTPFIGREHEIEMLSHQLLDPACRLLTLTGPGGVGKTRLAVEVARRLAPDSVDGTYFLGMVGVELPESILPVMANALGIVFSGPADQKLQMIQALNQKKALLIIDNMEHLISGSALFGDILEQAPGIRILLTSREPVHMQWEWVFEVQGLPVPESARPEVLESNSAVTLFTQRARQVSRQMRAGDESQERKDSKVQLAEAEAVVQICRLVDGLPLALELAASWARVMSPGEIAAELARGVGLLETTLNDVPARHRSIHHVFDQSWKLLGPEEREALMRLAVFPGGFTRETALSIAGVSVMLLSTLVDKSLMRYGKKPGRYDMHELVRQYVLARLMEHPDLEQSAHTRFGEFFAGWVFGLERALKSDQQISASDHLRAETANWSAAWRWAARKMRLDLLRQMASCLYWYDEIHANNIEALAFHASALDDLRSAGAPGTLTTDAQKGTFAQLLAQKGWFEFRIGYLEQAEVLFKESLEITKKLDAPDDYTLYLIFVDWGYLKVQTGEPEQAAQYLRQSLVHAQATGSEWNTAVAVNVLGIVEYLRGNMEEAFRQLNDSLARWREVGDPRGLVFCMLYLSMAAQAMGDIDAAEALLFESNIIAQQKHDRWAHAFGLDLLGQVAATRHQPQRARDLYQQSLEFSQEIGDQWAVTQIMIRLGDVLLSLGEQTDALSLFRQAYENARQAGWLPTLLEALSAALEGNSEFPAVARLSATLDVLSHPASNRSTCQRSENLREQLERTLDAEQREEAYCKSHTKTLEQWASALFPSPPGQNWLPGHISSGKTAQAGPAS